MPTREEQRNERIWQCGEVKVYAALVLNKGGKDETKKFSETTKNGFNRKDNVPLNDHHLTRIELQICNITSTKHKLHSSIYKSKLFKWTAYSTRIQ